jgi:hypothetical protein
MNIEDYNKKEIEFVTRQALEYVAKYCRNMDIEQQKGIVTAFIRGFISCANPDVPI